MNALQRHMASARETEPFPVRRIPRYALSAAEAIVEGRRAPRRRWWHWLRALLPLCLLVSVASANTIVVDLWGHIIGTFNWPSERNVVVVVPTSTGGPARSIFERPATPAPTPCPTSSTASNTNLYPR